MKRKLRSTRNEREPSENSPPPKKSKINGKKDVSDEMDVVDQKITITKSSKIKKNSKYTRGQQLAKIAIENGITGQILEIPETSSPNSNNSKPSINNSLSIESSSSSLLPEAYQTFENLFWAVETACSFFEIRKLQCSFEKLQLSVENITKRKFSLKQFSQICNILSDGYLVENFALPSQQSKVIISRTHLNKELNPSSTFTEDENLQRKKIFHEKLIENFNSNKNKLDDMELENKEGDDPFLELIEEAPLPPSKSVSLPENNKKISKLRQMVKEITSTPNPSSSLSSSVSVTNVKGNFGKINPQTVQKVRNKEKQNSLLAQSSEIQKQKFLFSQLPLLCEKLRSFYSVEKKSAILYSDIIEKLSCSYGGKYNREQIVEQIECLTNHLPEWCQIRSFSNNMNENSNTLWLKLDKEMPYTSVKQKLEELLTK